MRKLFTNGTIHTMERPGDRVSAVLTEDGVILAVGARAEAEAQNAECVDLNGRVLLPAFIDAHSHITALAQTLGLCDLSGARSFADIVALLKAYCAKNRLKAGEWVTGFGYDHNLLREKRHPNRFVLDSVSTNRPVLISNVSGHMGVVNTPALSALGIGADTEDPEGGKLGRKDGAPDGYLEEAAFFRLTERVPQPDENRRLELLENAQDVYFRNGITTVQDGLTGTAEYDLLARAAERGLLCADVVCYADLAKAGHLVLEHPERKRYLHGLKIGGYKIILDGSPQGRTAYLTAPYEGESNGYRGYPAVSDDVLRRYMNEAASEGVQLLAHCNGDAAAEQFLSAAERTAGVKRIRPVMIHAQTVRPDQVARMKAVGMIPSFFVAHIYEWGDVHLENLGARAYAISPAGTAAACGIPFTFHQDSPVLAPDMLQTVWCAVNRRTCAGALLGEEQRVSPYEALLAVTKYAAFQYFEEKSKGTIAPGKNADFVLLDRDPLTVPAEEFAEIQVLATFKGGRAAYIRQNS